MAERLLKKMLHSQADVGEDWQITSAGTWAVDGIAPDDKLMAVMDEFGIDISDHRSQMIDKAMIAVQDLVLVMEVHHQEALCFEFPEHCESIFLISQMINQTFDIADPFMRPLDAYRHTARELEEILTQGFEKIVQLAQVKGLSV